MWVNDAPQQSKTLLDAAYSSLQMGLSIIPIRGGKNVSTAKIAAIRWTEYRERFATTQEIDHWFNVQKFGGIAVVCGRLSQLVVLDFDDAHAHQRFARHFPHLTETYTILSATRRTPHLYWRTSLNVHGTNVQGGELRAEGQYVVTAPTAIAAGYYSVQNDAQIREIAAHELKEALNFLKPRQQRDDSTSYERTRDITHIYREAAPTIGRNNALYNASRHAKRSGWSLTSTIDTLAPIHTTQQPAGQHKPENTNERHREAIRTIESAFKHSATNAKASKEGIPNSIREKLIETQKTATTARLLDALYNANIREFTEAQATEVAKIHGIGRYSVLQALNGKFAEIMERRLFPIVIEENMVCKETKGVRKPGRTARVYRLPEHADLYTLLNVEQSSSDPLQTDDLRSGKRYRMAMHRNLIERRPGEYARGWLAARLGTSVRTLQRYNGALDMQVTPVYGYTRLDWDTIDDVPLALDRQRVTVGRWLQDADGKRYPALAALAFKLLKRDVAPVYVRRLPNHYTFGTVMPQKALWRCLKCSNHSDHLPQQCRCYTQALEHVGHGAETVNVRECIHCGQLCFDDKLVCKTCRRKREKPQSRITFDKAGKPRFPMRFNKTPLTRENIRVLLPDDFQRLMEIEDPHNKAWLQTPDGRRYPLIQGLAFRLLRQHGDVLLVTRDRSAETLYELGMNMLKRGMTKMGKHFLRRAGLR